MSDSPGFWRYLIHLNPGRSIGTRSPWRYIGRYQHRASGGDTVTLTDAAVRRIKPRDKAFKTQVMHGIHLPVQSGGGRYWRWDYRHDGKRGTVALGVYPNVSLKGARERRENARKLLEKGINPSSYGKLTRGVGSISAGDTFATVADEWLKKIEAEGRREM